MSKLVGTKSPARRFWIASRSKRQRGPRGHDAGKKANGRKRHILVDTIDLLLSVVVHVASIQDQDGAKQVFSKVKDHLPRLRLIWAGGGYAGKLADWANG